ncbi:hypothetical protein M513_07068, partial [Trichuris suis]
MLPFLDAALRNIHKQYYDDFVDRLNYYYTTLILLFLAILVSAKQYVGQPIQCWVPAQFRGGWEQYAENYCFVQNTYFLPFDKDVPREIVERDYRKIGYYQWVPIVLAIQALLFYMPNMLWKLLNWQSGINVKAVLEMASSAHLFETNKRQNTIRQLCRYLEDTLALQADMKGRSVRVLCVRLSRSSGNYLTCLYNFIKFLYLVNVCGQFFLMNGFLSTKYTFWGLQILADLANGREWPDSGHFPRVTLCDFDIRDLGNIHRHTVQCVLMINMFNEKIYLFLWFWMFLVGSATAGNLLYWICSSMSNTYREGMIQSHLRITADLGDTLSEKRLTQRFVRHALLPDGVLLLRFIKNHSGDMLTTELIASLFKDYVERNHLTDATDPKKALNRQSPSDNGRDTDHGFYDAEKYPSDGTNGSMSAPLLPSAPLISDKNNTLKAALHKHPQDDFADRLNYYYSTLILLILAIMVSAKQYVGQPIQCWVPAQFRGGWEEYAENYCFIQNTYFVPFDTSIPSEPMARKAQKIGYYQWVPIMLAMQALMFYLPNTFWNFMSWYSGFRLKSILQMAQDASGIDAERKEHTINVISHYIKHSIASRTSGHNMYFPFLGAKAGRQLKNIYVAAKLLFMINVLAQFLIMNRFLGTAYTFWGIQIMIDLLQGKEWSDSGHFPRVTLCDFEVRTMASVHKHTVQCVLMINMFNEKIYLFLWYWMFLVAICTTFNFVYWCCISFAGTFDERFVEYHLKVAKKESADTLTKGQINEFIRQCLKPDGVLLLRFIENCASDVLATDLIDHMYR